MTKSELKSIIKECIADEGISSISESDNCELISQQAFVIESLLAIIESEEEPEIVEEGANLDARAAFKKYKSEFKFAAKACKKAIKAGDKKAAMNESKNMDKALANIKDAINKAYDEKGSIGSAIFGWFTKGFVDLPRVLLLTMLSFPIGGLAGSIASIQDIINGIKVLIEDFKKDENLDNTLNGYRNQLLAYIKRMEAANKKLQSKISAM